MKQQSNNNLDELFQKAAKEYPLKTDNKNWDIVAAKLHTTPVSLVTKKSRKLQYTVLLLLLFAGSFFMVKNLNKNQPYLNANGQNAVSQKSSGINLKNNPAKTHEKNSSVQISHNNNLSSKNLAQAEKTIKDYKHPANTKIYSQNKETLNTTTDLLSTTTNVTRPIQQPAITVAPLFDNSNIKTDIKTNITTPLKNIFASEATNKKIVQNSKQVNKPATADNKKNEHITLRPQPKTFYGTLFFSPDFSTVKFQRINKPGYTIGVALGYKINNRISAELGLQRLHTNFYSDAKYVDKSNLKLKRTTVLEAVNGNNKLTQVPVAIRFNLLKNNDHFFATGGTTVALITHKEKYNYSVTKNGSPDNISRKFNALTGTKFFSSVNLSAGYLASVSNIFRVKIEPYYQIPTKKLGIGNIPVSNFGVNIGIVKYLK